MSGLLHLGFDNNIAIDKVIGIFAYNTSPIKRMIQEARQSNMLIDITSDKKTKSVILTTNDYIILSPISVRTLSKRFISKGIED